MATPVPARTLEDASSLGTAQIAAASLRLEYSLLVDQFYNFARDIGLSPFLPYGLRATFRGCPWDTAPCLAAEGAFYGLGGVSGRIQAGVAFPRDWRRRWRVVPEANLGVATFSERTLFPAVTGASLAYFLSGGTAVEIPAHGRWSVSIGLAADVYPFMEAWLPGPAFDVRLGVGASLAPGR